MRIKRKGRMRQKEKDTEWKEHRNNGSRGERARETKRLRDCLRHEKSQRDDYSIA